MRVTFSSSLFPSFSYCFLGLYDLILLVEVTGADRAVEAVRIGDVSLSHRVNKRFFVLFVGLY